MNAEYRGLFEYIMLGSSSHAIRRRHNQCRSRWGTLQCDMYVQAISGVHAMCVLFREDRSFPLSGQASLRSHITSCLLPITGLVVCVSTSDGLAAGLPNPAAKTTRKRAVEHRHSSFDGLLVLFPRSRRVRNARRRAIPRTHTVCSTIAKAWLLRDRSCWASGNAACSTGGGSRWGIVAMFVLRDSSVPKRAPVTKRRTERLLPRHVTRRRPTPREQGAGLSTGEGWTVGCSGSTNVEERQGSRSRGATEPRNQAATKPLLEQQVGDACARVGLTKQRRGSLPAAVIDRLERLARPLPWSRSSPAPAFSPTRNRVCSSAHLIRSAQAPRQGAKAKAKARAKAHDRLRARRRRGSAPTQSLDLAQPQIDPALLQGRQQQRCAAQSHRQRLRRLAGADWSAAGS